MLNTKVFLASSLIETHAIWPWQVHLKIWLDILANDLTCQMILLSHVVCHPLHQDKDSDLSHVTLDSFLSRLICVRFCDLLWRHYMMVSWDWYKDYQLVAAFDSLPNNIWIITDSYIHHRCWETGGRIHNREYLHQLGCEVTSRTR